MKKFMLCLAVLLLVSGACFATKIALHHPGGSEVYVYPSDQVSKVDLNADGSVTVSFADGKTAATVIPAESFSYFTLVGDEVPDNPYTGQSGVAALESGGAVVEMAGGYVTIKGESGRTCIYSVGGALVSQGDEKAPTENLTPGVYMVTRGRVSAKIAIGR